METAFSIAWAEYKKGNSFAISMKALLNYGIKERHAENILHSAFCEGWRELPSTSQHLKGERLYTQEQVFRYTSLKEQFGSEEANEYLQNFKGNV